MGKDKYLMSYKVACEYLAVPETCVPSKQMFSAAGAIISKKGSKLSDENATMLIKVVTVKM